MNTALRNRFSTYIMILIFLVTLLACGGGGNGAPAADAPGTPPGDAPIIPPGGEPPAGGPGATVPTGETFTWTGNTRLTVAAANGLLANDPAGTVITAADTATSRGGVVNVNLTNGSFTYDPPLGLQNVPDTFTYTPAGFAPLTVTINLVERIWFVRNNDIGANQGNDRAPFLTLAQAQNASDTNDTIFVFAGNGTVLGQNAGITLKTGQRLIGEGVGLRVNGVPIVDPIPEAVISNAGLVGAGALNIPAVMLVSGNEVAGFAIQAAFNEAILAPGGTGHNLHDNTITFAAGGREGIRLLNVTGNNTVTANTITGSPRNAIKFANNENQAGDPVPATPIAAAVTMSRNTIRNSAQDGIRVILDGAGTDVKVNALTNEISNSGTAGANQGIDIAGLGAAKVTAIVSRNTISNSTAQATDLAASGTSAMAAFVANNALSASGAATDFRNIIANTATACLELINNINAAANSTFRVDNNNAAGAAAFRFFETGNDNLAVRAPIGAFTAAARGDCAVALPGAALFEANCAICHTGNGLGFGNVGPDITNRTAALISLQLDPATGRNPTMNTIKLTPEEVLAIAAALVAVP